MKEKKYFIENENLVYEEFNNYDEAIKRLSSILNEQCNYNFNKNKDNYYSLYVSYYDEKIKDNVADVIKNISISEFKNMNAEEKEKFLS